MQVLSAVMVYGSGFLTVSDTHLGFLLVIAERMGDSNRGIKQMNYRNALFIGFVQGVATVSYTHLDVYKRQTYDDTVIKATVTVTKDEHNKLSASVAYLSLIHISEL